MVEGIRQQAQDMREVRRNWEGEAMTKPRQKPPLCMGQRMSGDPDRWFLKLEPLGVKVIVNALADGYCEWAIVTLDIQAHYLELDTATGQQAAANAAERWLVKRAELTLKLAGRRAG
jgi:hypothetical protein